MNNYLEFNRRELRSGKQNKDFVQSPLYNNFEKGCNVAQLGSMFVLGTKCLWVQILSSLPTCKAHLISSINPHLVGKFELDQMPPINHV